MSRTNPMSRQKSARPRLEQHEQTDVVRLLRLAGFAVYVTSQRRPSQVALGIPDLLLLHPDLGLGAWETKRDGGALRPAQATFAQRCERSGALYGSGTLADCERWLATLGLGRFDGAQFILTPRGRFPDPPARTALAVGRRG